MKTRFLSLIKRIAGNKILRILISISLLILVFRNIDLQHIFQGIKTVPLTVSVSYIFIMTGVSFLLSLRWKILTLPSSSNKFLPHFFVATMMGMFYNLFLPSQNGGDLVKWTFLNNLHLSKKYLLFTTAFDRIAGLAGLIILGALAAIPGSFIFHAQYDMKLISLFIFLSLCSISFIGFVLFPEIIKKVQISFFRQHFENLFSYLHKNKFEIMRAILLTVFAQIIYFIAVWIVLQGVGITLSIVQVITFGAIVSIVVALPISFSGFGTTELAYIYFFVPQGIQKEKILVFTTLLTIYKIVNAIIGWTVGTAYQSKLLQRIPQ